jgi:glucosyl-dolichyl phosphate glucuronosyltransferase
MIAVIIPTRNRSDLIVSALHSLTKQTLPANAFETIVVDNGSTDNTAEIVQSYQSILSNLRYFFEPGPGLHAGRHRGMLEAKGDVLVFADDDIEAFPTWLTSIADIFQDPGVAMAGGNNLPAFLEKPPEWLHRMWNRQARDGSRSLPYLSIQERPSGHYPISPYQVWGCNFAIRKDVLLAAGGFHPDGMPKELIRFRGDGETHVSRYVEKNGLKCLFYSGASIYHKVTPERMTFAYFNQRGFNQGVSDSYTKLRGEDVQITQKRLLPFRIAGWGWHKLQHLKNTYLEDAGIMRAMNEYRKGYREGFSYHQAAYSEDLEVRNWVHRKDYYR